jgi:hypothetical protein
MKILFLLCTLTLLTTSKTCKKKQAAVSPGCFRGKLLVKGGCMNYTIGMIGSNIDTA